MDELDIGARAALGEGHAQGVEDQVCAHVAGELPADDPAAVGVDDKAEEDQALPAAQVGEVRHPQLVGPLGAEVPLDKVGAAVRGRVGERGAPGLGAALGAPNAVVAHQALHLTARGLLAGPQQRFPGASVAVGLVVGPMDLPDSPEQPLVGDGPRRRLGLGAGVEGRRRHVQGVADGLDAEAAAVLVDVAAHLVRSSSSSLAKNTEADFKISFARRSSKFSRLS